MKLADFGYHLPEELIAQEPCPERDQSRMMVLDRGRGTIRHSIFRNFPGHLKKGDALVINNSKVIPARLMGTKETGGRVEVLLLSRKNATHARRETWEVLLRPAKSIKPGIALRFGGEGLATVMERINDKKWHLDFTTLSPFNEFLEQAGTPPLPPYIKRREKQARSPEDKNRYQTIYARLPGSVAAPTAGLHFSPAVMAALEGREIPVAPITLHVGYGTFRPMEAEDVEDHRMEEEHYEISEEAAKLINSAVRVVAVGTTSTRTLEGAADEAGRIHPGRNTTDLYIYPGYRFRSVGALLTNFHLPKSTLYLLACTFAGCDLIREAYRQAIEERYRFYSYGDCMLIL